MTEYDNYFKDRPDKDLMKKAFYDLVKLKLTEEQAWYALTNAMTGMDYSQYCINKEIKNVLHKLKVDYKKESKEREKKENNRINKFKKSLKPETIAAVKNIWNSLE